MIKQTLVMSLVLISAQAIASTPCPTCSRIYPSIEEILITQQKEKESALKKMLQESSLPQAKTGENTQKKSSEEYIAYQMGTENSRARLALYGLQSRASKRDRVLEATDAPSKRPQAGSPYFSNEQGNQNLRGTFDRSTALSTHLQNRER